MTPSQDWGGLLVILGFPLAWVGSTKYREYCPHPYPHSSAKVSPHPRRYQPPKAHFLDTAVALSNQDEAAEPNWPTGRFLQTCSAPALLATATHWLRLAAASPRCQPLECVYAPKSLPGWPREGGSLAVRAGPAGELLLDPFTDEPSPLHGVYQNMQDVHWAPLKGWLHGSLLHHLSSGYSCVHVGMWAHILTQRHSLVAETND